MELAFVLGWEPEAYSIFLLQCKFLFPSCFLPRLYTHHLKRSNLANCRVVELEWELGFVSELQLESGWM